MTTNHKTHSFQKSEGKKTKHVSVVIEVTDDDDDCTIVEPNRPNRWMCQYCTTLNTLDCNVCTVCDMRFS